MAKLLLSSQTYVIVKRALENNQQYSFEKEEEICLYEDRIVSASDNFYLDDVLDMSYKVMTSPAGMLYLHTNRGLFSYIVKSEPQHFIDTYKQLKGSNQSRL